MRLAFHFEKRVPLPGLLHILPVCVVQNLCIFAKKHLPGFCVVLQEIQHPGGHKPGDGHLGRIIAAPHLGEIGVGRAAGEQDLEHPAVVVFRHRPDGPRTALGIAHDAQAFRVDLFKEQAAGAGVLFQQVVQGLGGGQAGSGLSVVIAHRNEAPGGQPSEKGLIVQRRRVAGVDHQNGRVGPGTALQLRGIPDADIPDGVIPVVQDGVGDVVVPQSGVLALQRFLRLEPGVVVLGQQRLAGLDVVFTSSTATRITASRTMARSTIPTIFSNFSYNFLS